MSECRRQDISVTQNVGEVAGDNKRPRRYVLTTTQAICGKCGEHSGVNAIAAVTRHWVAEHCQ